MPATHPAVSVGTDREPGQAPRLSAVPDEGPERRRSGRRARARDRLMDRATRPYPQNAALIGVENVENLLLFVDDDLRETALAINEVEKFLLRTLGLLETPNLRREEVQSVASDTSVLDNLDLLNETVESLRRRLARLSARMK